MRIAIRVVFLLLVVVLLAVGGFLAWFSSWRSEKLSRLESASAIARTKAGPVEYVRSGDGPAVLVFHGAPGGFDQAMLAASDLVEHGFQVIAPSRPGYLRTPLASGLTPEDQADAMAALLDSLGIDSTAVLGLSLGAPAAIQFAVRHPDKIWALVLVSPVTKRMAPKPDQVDLPALINERLTGDVGSWAFAEMAAREPRKAASIAFDLTRTGSPDPAAAQLVGNPSELAWFQDLAGTLAPLSPRESGLRNDMLQLRVLPTVRFDKLAVPTLFIQGENDRWLAAGDVAEAAKKLPGSEILMVPDAGHVVWLGGHAGSVNGRILEFLNRFHGGQSAP